MKILISKRVQLSVFLLLLSCCFNAAAQAIMIENSRQDIEACKGKLKLELVRVWGGDEEQDENKFFRYPMRVAVDTKKRVYISDIMSHTVKVFDHTGKFIRRIGRKGRGPGDVYSIFALTIAPNGDLVVLEDSGRRVQWFTPEGKSRRIQKLNKSAIWFDINSKGDLVFENDDRDIEDSGKLTLMCDKNGNTIKKFGDFLLASTSQLTPGMHLYSMDDVGCVYVMNRYLPVIRRYSPDGNLESAIAIEPPFKITTGVALNSRGDELIIQGEPETGKYKVSGNANSKVVTIVKSGKRPIFMHIGSDSNRRLYVVTYSRLPTEEDSKNNPRIMGSFKRIKVTNLENARKQKRDYLELLAFNPDGKVIAQAPLTQYFGSIHISGDRLFLIDTFVDQRILEYRIEISK